MGKEAEVMVKEEELNRGRLIGNFLRELANVLEEREGLKEGSRRENPRRKLKLSGYLSPHLFGLFNPMVRHCGHWRERVIWAGCSKRCVWDR